MSRVLSILLLLISHGGLGQFIAKNDILADLRYLNEAVVKGHPANYRPNDTINLGAIVRKAEAIQRDSIPVFEYRLLLGEALQQIGCLHTSITKLPILPKVVTKRYPPLDLKYLDGKLLVVYRAKGVSEVEIGDEILSINGIETKTVLDDLLTYLSSDGGGKVFAAKYVDRQMLPLLAWYFNFPATYAVGIKDTTVVLEAYTSPLSTTPKPLPQEAVLTNNRNSLTFKEEVAVLKIASFSKSDIPFFKSALSRIHQNGSKNLVIDLRDNTGGNRNATVTLTKMLVDTTFSYSILQPKLHPGRYLNGKGKFFLFLSKLKYNVGDIFKGKRTGFGREFTYRYKPGKPTYQGNLYVITNGFTASASTMLTSWLKQHTDAVLVGSQAGGGYNGNNGGAFPTLTLPKSKTEITFPAYRLILDHDSEQRQGIVPDIEVKKTLEQVLQKQDAEMDAIFALILKQEHGQ
jgi:hypothetical protein